MPVSYYVDLHHFSQRIILTHIWDHTQSTSISPDGKILAVLGDSAECLLADANTGKVSV